MALSSTDWRGLALFWVGRLDSEGGQDNGIRIKAGGNVRQKWDYRIESLVLTGNVKDKHGKLVQLDKYLQELGQDGWELIFVDDATDAKVMKRQFIFKRPLEK